jgi:hypothetical protein
MSPVLVLSLTTRSERGSVGTSTWRSPMPTSALTA